MIGRRLLVFKVQSQPGRLSGRIEANLRDSVMDRLLLFDAYVTRSIYQTDIFAPYSTLVSRRRGYGVPRTGAQGTVD